MQELLASTLTDTGLKSITVVFKIRGKNTARWNLMTSLGPVRELAHDPNPHPKVCTDRRLNYRATHWDQFSWGRKYQNHELGILTKLWGRCGLLWMQTSQDRSFMALTLSWALPPGMPPGLMVMSQERWFHVSGRKKGKVAVLRCACCFCCNKESTALKMILPDFQMERKLSGPRVP